MNFTAPAFHDAPYAEVRYAFDFEAELASAKKALADKKEASIAVGRCLRNAKQAGKYKEFCEALGILTVTGEGYLLQADLADGNVKLRKARVAQPPKYTLQELREMLVAAESLEQAIAAIDMELAGGK